MDAKKNLIAQLKEELVFLRVQKKEGILDATAFAKRSLELEASISMLSNPSKTMRKNLVVTNGIVTSC